jgi:uncharacterized protein (UPF0332 family)
MPIKATEFLDIAEWIHKPGHCDKEIGFRCSVSRAYYAAFHVAKEHLQMDEDAEHKEVIERLKDFDDKFGDDELSGRLLDLKKKRKKADYRLSYKIDREQAHKVLDKSKEFIAKVVKLKIP